MAQDGVAVQPVTPGDRWSNRRIIFLAFVTAIIFYAIFNLPATINYILTRARQTLILIILSIALAYLLLPLVDLLARLRVPLTARMRRITAALVALILFTVLLVVLIAVTITPITSELGKTLTTVTHWVQEDFMLSVDGFLNRVVAQLPEPYRTQAVQQRLELETQLSPEVLLGAIQERIEQWGVDILRWPVNLLGSVLSGGASLIALLIVPVFAFYFLTDATSMRLGIASYVPVESRQRYHQMLGDMDVVIRGYTRTITIVSLLTALATSLTLYFAGVRPFLTFGILAGVCNMVPVVGGVVAVILVASISLMTVGFKVTLIIMAVYTVIQVVTDRIITPKLMSQEVHLHPVSIMIALLVGAEFFGMIGVFVAVPALAALRVAWTHYRAYLAKDFHGRELDDLLGRAETTPKTTVCTVETQAPAQSDDAAVTAHDTAVDADEATDGDT